MVPLARRLAAEAFGTFVLVFVGASAIVASKFPGGTDLLGIALAHGLALAVGVTATMRISGGHLNPAVTAGLLVGRRIAPRDAAAYLVAQVAGAVLAALLVKVIYPSGVASVVNYGAPSIFGQFTLVQAIWLEAALTFLLVSAVYGTAVASTAPSVGGFGIGLMLAACILVGGPLTGAALNPARAFGPALIASAWTGHAAYWIGPLLGGVVAGVLWDRVLLKGEQRA
jgi:MIP family channel proteins